MYRMDMTIMYKDGIEEAYKDKPIEAISDLMRALDKIMEDHEIDKLIIRVEAIEDKKHAKH